MGFFGKILAYATTAREWFSFANDTISAFGLLQRAAAATATVAAIAAPVYVVKTMMAPTHELASSQAINGGAKPGNPGDFRYDTNNPPSRKFLSRPENRPILAALVKKCGDDYDESIPEKQCRVINGAWIDVRSEEARRAASGEVQNMQGGDITNLKVIQ